MDEHDGADHNEKDDESLNSKRRLKLSAENEESEGE